MCRLGVWYCIVIKCLRGGVGRRNQLNTSSGLLLKIIYLFLLRNTSNRPWSLMFSSLNLLSAVCVSFVANVHTFIRNRVNERERERGILSIRAMACLHTCWLRGGNEDILEMMNLFTNRLIFFEMGNWGKSLLTSPENSTCVSSVCLEVFSFFDDKRKIFRSRQAR